MFPLTELPPRFYTRMGTFFVWFLIYAVTGLLLLRPQSIFTRIAGWLYLAFSFIWLGMLIIGLMITF